MAEHLKRYNEEFGERVTVADLDGEVALGCGCAGAACDAREVSTGRTIFFAVLGVMPDAQRVMQALQRGV